MLSYLTQMLALTFQNFLSPANFSVAAWPHTIDLTKAHPKGRPFHLDEILMPGGQNLTPS